jgi:polyisoprenoid-binding protein YceI
LFIGFMSTLLGLGCGDAGSQASKGQVPWKNSSAVVAPVDPKPSDLSTTSKTAPGEISPANTKIEFIGTKPNGRHEGGFSKFSGKFEPIDADLTTSKITVDIEAGSLYTDTQKLTGHLKTPDFFDVNTYPEASFVSTAIKAGGAGDGTHTITGDLSLHGTKKSVSFPAKITLADDSLKLASEFKINRKDFGMNFSRSPVDDDVTIKITARVARK